MATGRPARSPTPVSWIKTGAQMLLDAFAISIAVVFFTLAAATLNNYLITGRVQAPPVPRELQDSFDALWRVLASLGAWIGHHPAVLAVRQASSSLGLGLGSQGPAGLAAALNPLPVLGKGRSLLGARDRGYIALASLVAAPLCFILVLAYRLVLCPYLHHRFLRSQGVPAHPFVPLVGQFRILLSILMTDSYKIGEPYLPQLLEDRKKIGADVCAVGVGPVVRLRISEPALVRAIMVTKSHCYVKSSVVRRIFAVLGNGLLTAEGDHWARERRMLNPAFGPKQLKAVIPLMLYPIRTALDRWSARVAAAAPAPCELEMQSELQGLTLDIFTRAMFGLSSMSGDSARAKTLTGALHEHMGFTFQAALSPLGQVPGYSLFPTSANRATARTATVLRQLTSELIEERRSLGTTDGQDLLSTLLAARDDETLEAFTDEQLVDESLTFLLAGHHTTATMVTFTLLLLAIHPEYQARARDEAQAVLAGKDAPNADDVGQMKLLQVILFESLRMYPPAPFTSRRAAVDHELVAQVRGEKAKAAPKEATSGPKASSGLQSGLEAKDSLGCPIVKESGPGLEGDLHSKRQGPGVTSAMAVGVVERGKGGIGEKDDTELHHFAPASPGPPPSPGPAVPKPGVIAGPGQAGTDVVVNNSDGHPNTGARPSVWRIKVKKGMEVMVVPYLLHHREDLWTGGDVHVFRPERFAGGVTAAVKHPAAYMPFGVGPRTCIGQNFAMLEAKLLLSMLLRRFKFRLAPGYKHKPEPRATLRAKYGMQLIFEPVE